MSGEVTGAGSAIGDDEALRRASQRVALLLEELHDLCTPPAWLRVEQLVQSLVDLYGGALDRVIAHARAAASIEALRDRIVGDDLVASLLLLHGLHPQSAETRIGAALGAAREALGPLSLVERDGEAVIIRASPESVARLPAQALARAIERIVREAAPEIGEVRIEGLPSATGAPGGLVQIDLRRSRETEGAAIVGAAEARP